MKWDIGKSFERIMQVIRKQKSLLMTLSVMTIFVTTYLLILPAITLDEDTAKDQGGIDVPAAEEMQDAEQAQEPDADTDAKPAEGSDTDKSTAANSAGGLTYEGKGFTVEAAFDAKAGLPEDTSLEVIEIQKDAKDYDAWHDEALKAVQEADGGESVADLKFAKFYDISLLADGEPVEPGDAVDVSINYDKALKVADADHVRIIHFGVDEKGNLVPEVLDPKDVELDLAKGKMSGAAFAAESFSVYGVVYTVDLSSENDAQISDHVITADGQDYIINVSYDDEAQIPEGAELKVTEITDADAHFDDYLQRALEEIEEPDPVEESGEGESNAESAPDVTPEDAVNAWPMKPVSVAADHTYARFFDIEIQADGKEVEPKMKVSVQISLANVPETAQEGLQVVHFGENGDELMTVDAIPDVEENAAELSFETEGFSVYAIASQGDGTDVNIFTKQYVLVHNNVALSPEPNPTNNNHLRGISVDISGNTISTNEAALPVWTIERYWDNTAQDWRYLLSTMRNGSKVYLNLVNENNGSATVSANPQALLLDTRNNNNYECRFRVAESPNAALDLDYDNIVNGFHAYINGNNVYFRLYELGEEINNKLTVHFVDRAGNPVPGVTYSGQNTSQVTPKGNSTFEIPYDWKSQNGATVNLRDDFTYTGYTYASSHLAGQRPDEDELTYGGLTIDEKLHSTGSSLEFYSDRGVNAMPVGVPYPYSDPDSVGNTGYFNPVTYDFNDELKVWKSNIRGDEVAYSPAGVDKDVYVILDPTNSGTGTSTSGSGSSVGSNSGNTGDSLDVDEPNFQKKLVKNGDGTYTLSLSVTGHSKNISERPKANILFVVDTSSSMTGSTSGGSNRLNDTKAELALLGQQLLDKNTPGEVDPSVEVTMISFDGNVTDEITGNNNEAIWIDDKNTFTSIVNSPQHLVPTNGTDWEDALNRALDIANDKKAEEPDQPVFIVFFTDGEPSQYTNFHGQGSDGYYHYYNYYLSRESSKDELRAIVRAGHRLYGVYAFNQYGSGSNANQHPTTPYNNEKGHDLLHHAIQYGYDTTANLEGSYYHYASNRADLNKAFTSILRSINEVVGFDDLVLNDSITSLTSVGATNAEGSAQGFKYTRSGGNYGAGQPWNDAPKVTFTEASGDNLAKVSWDLSSCGYLEDGVTYTVSFTVWPCQEAYDYVTKLNNGFITIEQVPEEARSCFLYNKSTGKYEVRTNPESGPDNEGNVTNEIDYKKEQAYTVVEKPAGASTDPNNPDIVTSQAGDWPQTQTKTWYEQNDDDTWTKHVITEVVTAFGPPDKNMELDNNAFKIQKKWEVSREEEMIQFLYDVTTGLPIEAHKYIRFNVQQVDNPDEPVDFSRVDMGYDEEWGDYKWAGETHTVPVHDIPHQVGTTWEKDLEISYGLMISPDYAAERGLYLKDARYIPIYRSEADKEARIISYYVLEKGHDYKIDEPALDYRFDFQTEVYHPMLVDGTPSNVKISYHGNEYGILEESGAESKLKGTNVLRGELRMSKIVIGLDDQPDTSNDALFNFRVTLTNNDDPGPFYDDPTNLDEHNIPWYGVKVNGEGDFLYYHKIEPNPDGSYEYTDELHACVGGNYLNGLLEGYEGNRMQQDSDNPRNIVTADIRIKATDEWNITNIPSGTTYEIEETLTKGYEFVKAEEIGNTENLVQAPSDPEITGGVPVNTVTKVEFTNKITPTALEVKKVWTDDEDVDHSQDYIEYKINRYPYHMVKNDQTGQEERVNFDPEVVAKLNHETQQIELLEPTVEGFTGILNEANQWTETIDTLPKAGTNNGIAVLYEYYVTEEEMHLADPPEGQEIIKYKSSSDGGEITEGNNKGEFSYTITNEPMGETDQETEIDVEKKWKYADGEDDNRLHKDDSIKFNLIQKKYEAKVKLGDNDYRMLYPITLNLTDKKGNNSNTRENSPLSTVVYVPSGASFIFTPTELATPSGSGHGEHRVDVTVNGTTMPVQRIYNGESFTINEVNSALDITFKMVAGDDLWVESAMQQFELYHQWTFALNSNKQIIWHLDEMLQHVIVEGEGGPAQTAPTLVPDNPTDRNPKTLEYTMTLNAAGNGTIIDYGMNAQGQVYGSENEIWKGSIKNLIVYEYKKNANNPELGGNSYIYTYEVEEAAVRTSLSADPEMVNKANRNDPEDPDHPWNGETSSYDVKWYETDSGLWRLINQEKDEIGLTIHKVDKSDLNDPTFKPLPGAKFKLVKYKLEGNEDDRHWVKDPDWGDEDEGEISESPPYSGIFNLGNLKFGYYEIVEIEFPAGYIQPSDNPKFQLRVNPETHKREAVLVYNENDETGHKIGEPIQGNATELVKIGIENEGARATVTFGNEPGVALPSSGGPGTTWIYIIGIIMILGCGISLVARRRARKLT